jgi:parallel beta-helix repeat protein
METRQHFSRYSIVTTCLLTCLSVGSLAYAATYYVSKTGNDNNSCSNARQEVAAKKTINAGIGCMVSGDTLIIKSGTYAEGLNNNVPSGTSWTNATRIMALPGETVILKPSSGATVISISSVNAKYMIFDNLIIDASNMSSNGFKIEGDKNIKHIKIQNGEVKNLPNGWSCIGVEGGGTEDIIIANMRVHDCKGNTDGPGDHGTYYRASNGIIENSEFYNNSGYGIQIYSSKGETVQNVVIRNNRVYNNGIDGNGGIVLGGSTENNLIYNNIIFNNRKGVILGGSSNKFYNNIVYGSELNGIVNKSSNIQLINNIIYSNNPNISDSGSGTKTSNNLQSNPQFMDIGNNDFRLKSSSPAIDAGVALMDVPNDIKGVPRPQGDGHDIGAYEYTTASGQLSPPKNLRVLNVD